MRTMIFGAAMAVGLGTAALAADRPAVVKPFTPPPPAGPQYFLWIEGGYSHLNLAEAHAFDFGAPLAPVFFRIDDGWYARGEAGFVPAQRLGMIDAISLAISYRRGSADEGAAGGPVGLSYVDPTNNATTIRSPGVATAEQNFALLDIALRLKHAPGAWPGVTVNFEPFYSRVGHDVSASIDLVAGGAFQARTAKIDGDIFGAMLAIEGQRAVSPTLRLRGRASLGAYHGKADGVFAFFPFAGISDSRSRNFDGVRAGVEIGADFALTPNLSLGVTAGVDHWSKMPFPRLTQTGGAPPVGIDTKGFTDYFVGARLTFFTGVSSSVVTTY